LKPQAILEKTLQIENEDFNRIRTEKWTARIIDIDILFYNDEVIKTDNLVIPHPHLHQRNFVLIPLMEIAGEMEHPILKETIEDLYWKSEDSLEVLIVED
jgi:2-amino-4-hydroxy-6-hydroxymethyldihydropteridine diphosphokinase